MQLIPQEIQLSASELEQAMSAVNLAWLEAEGLEVEIRIPKSLHHLTMEQWEEVSCLLMILQHQALTSPIQ